MEKCLAQESQVAGSSPDDDSVAFVSSPIFRVRYLIDRSEWYCLINSYSCENIICHFSFKSEF